MERRVSTFAEFFVREKLTDSLTLLDITPVRQDSEAWAEFFELLLPVEKSAVRSDNEERTPYVFPFGNMSEQSDRLDGLSKTHFVSEDTVNALLKKVVQPSETLDLIFFETAMEGRRSSNQL